MPLPGCDAVASLCGRSDDCCREPLVGAFAVSGNASPFSEERSGLEERDADSAAELEALSVSDFFEVAGDEFAAAASDTVTLGRIFSMVLSATPAFFKSATDEYGRCATIFFAVAGPTPVRESSSFSDAVFRSTLDADCSCFCSAFLSDFFLLVLRANAGAAIKLSSSTAASTRCRLCDFRRIVFLPGGHCIARWAFVT